MKRNIILLPRVIDDIKSLYAKLNKDALPLSQQLSIDFCPNDRGLIYREYGDSIQVWSEDMYLRCQYASEKDSLKVVRVEACQKFQYHFIYIFMSLAISLYYMINY